YDVHIVVIPGMEEHGESVAAALSAEGFDVLLDDREARAGEKFADADLIGCPVRVTVGRKVAEDGTVDVRERAKGDDKAVSVGELVSTVREILGSWHVSAASATTRSARPSSASWRKPVSHTVRSRRRRDSQRAI